MENSNCENILFETHQFYILLFEIFFAFFFAWFIDLLSAIIKFAQTKRGATDYDPINKCFIEWFIVEITLRNGNRSLRYFRRNFSSHQAENLNLNLLQKGGCNEKNVHLERLQISIQCLRVRKKKPLFALSSEMRQRNFI